MLTSHQRIAIRRRFPDAEFSDNEDRENILVALSGQSFVYAMFLAGGWIVSPSVAGHNDSNIIRAARDLEKILAH